MNSKIKFAALALVQTVASAALVACGGGTDPAADTTSTAQSADGRSQAESARQIASDVTVTLTASAGGAVTSSPAGINCSTTNTAGCTATFPHGTMVTLTAKPATGYGFTNWTGSCDGTALVCAGTVNNVNRTTVAAGAIFTASQSGGGGGGSSGSPMVSYTDALSGPTTGGENNLGAYLSLFGSNLGTASGLGTTTKVYIGGVEVANYRYLGAAKVAGKLGLQQITVQVGNLGLPMGTPQPIKVVVNGVSSNVTNTFTPNPGRILFVSLTGNDDSAVANDITHPWRHLQTPSAGGIAAILQAGDHIVIRGGNWSDIGFDYSWFRFRYSNQQGTAPTGAAKTGWIQFTAYPGPIKGNAIEDVHYSTPANQKGGIQGSNSAYYGTTGDYISISNLRMDVNANATSDAAPINLQYSAGPWRVVNNELGPWPAAIHSLAAGVSGHGNGTTVLGNHIHDIACVGAFENHGIYADSGASNWNVGYNWIHDITGGNLIQFYDNVGLAGNNFANFPQNWQGFTGMNIHHNWLENSGKYGLNMADGIVSGQIWNNVVKGAALAGLRFNTISKNMNMTIAFNTFYDNDRVFVGSGDSQVLNTWGNYGPTGTIRIYNNVIAAGPNTIRNGSYYQNIGNTDAYLDFKRNLYYDNGYGWANLSRDPLGLIGDPKFTSAATSDLTLMSSSPAINTGTQASPLTITDDMTRKIARPEGGANDIGAYERVM